MCWVGKIFLLLIGTLWIIFGVSATVIPKQVKIFYSRVLKQLDLQKVGSIPIVTGIIIYICSSMSSLSLLVKSIAILAILKGLFFIFIPKDKAKDLLNRWLQLSDWFYRFSGVITFTLGLLIIYSLFS